MNNLFPNLIITTVLVAVGCGAYEKQGTCTPRAQATDEVAGEVARYIDTLPPDTPHAVAEARADMKTHELLKGYTICSR